VLSAIVRHPTHIATVAMAKGGKKRSRNTASGWTASDHDAQVDKKERKNQKTQISNAVTSGPNRTAHLTHNTLEKRDARKLQLHIAKVQRELNELKERLSNWDPVREAQRRKERLQKELKEQEAEQGLKKRKGRLGPESWKLRGAARPAWEVYDFDTRYVDPHAKEHEQAAATAARSQNLLRARASDGPYPLHSVAPDEAREYLMLLMQLGYLSQEAKQYKTARAAFLECIDLEGDDDGVARASSPPTNLTTAREACMRMYLELERYDAAFRLGERFSKDTSSMIRFSMAVLAIRLQKEEAIVRNLMLQAIRCNIFATLYLCHCDTFMDAMEFTEELQESDDEPQSTLEEALEYCSSTHAALWQQTDGAIQWLQRSVQDDNLTPGDRDWKDRLSQIESQFRTRNAEKHNDECGNDSQLQGIDVLMYSGMFRTAMDMVQDPLSF
jgi:hypothetical protein